VIELLVVTRILILPLTDAVGQHATQKHRQLKEGARIVKIPPLNLRLLQESLFQIPFHHFPHPRLHKIMLSYQPIILLNRKARRGVHLTEYKRDQPELSGSHAQTRP
jgi:hypothetical protein